MSDPYGVPGGGQPPQMRPTSSGKSITVLVLGICGLVLTPGCGAGVILAIVALVLAPSARREVQDSQGRLSGLGFVKAGVICSWIAVALMVALVALLMLMRASARA